MEEKLKYWILNDRVYLVTLVVLVGLSTFALGWLSAGGRLGIDGGKAGAAAVAMTYTSEATVTGVSVSTSSNAVPSPHSTSTSTTIVVASKNGTKYHLPGCPGAKQIKPENKLTFDSEQAAQAAGYERAGNCKGFNN